MNKPERHIASHPLLRLLRHRWVDETALARALPSAALLRLQERVRVGEATHSGEVRVCMEAGLPWSYIARRASARERAISVFGKLRVWDTEHNNGVLIYLLLAERQIEVVADRGITRCVPQPVWDSLVQALQVALRNSQFEAGLQQAVDAVNALLQQHFALQEGQSNPNELADAPVTLLGS